MSEVYAPVFPGFDGETYEAARDGDRLQAQLTRVWRILCDHQWHTLTELSMVTGDPATSLSARIRDLRKRQFGGYQVDRRYVTRGLWEYRLSSTIPPTGVAR